MLPSTGCKHLRKPLNDHQSGFFDGPHNVEFRFVFYCPQLPWWFWILSCCPYLIHTGAHAYACSFWRENPVFCRKSKDPSVCLVMPIHSSSEYPLNWPQVSSGEVSDFI